MAALKSLKAPRLLPKRMVVGAAAVLLGGLFLGSFPELAGASPYGRGSYNENVPYGSLTDLTINTSGDITVPVVPSMGGTLNTASGTVTVTSTDVIGYDLYVRAATTTNLTKGGDTIPASANGSPGTLSTNTWGYNATGSTTNFVGMTMTDTLIHSLSGPSTAGDVTSVTYGVKVDTTQPSGNYSTVVTYTAVPQTM